MHKYLLAFERPNCLLTEEQSQKNSYSYYECSNTVNKEIRSYHMVINFLCMKNGKKQFGAPSQCIEAIQKDSFVSDKVEGRDWKICQKKLWSTMND